MERTYNFPTLPPDQDWCLSDDLRATILALPEGEAREAFVRHAIQVHEERSVMLFVIELQKDFRTGNSAIDQRNLAQLIGFIVEYYDGVITPRNLQLAYSACQPYLEKLPPPPPPLPVDKRRGIIKPGATRKFGDDSQTGREIAAEIRQRGNSSEDLKSLRIAVNAALAQRRGASAAGKADRSIGVQ